MKNLFFKAFLAFSLVFSVFSAAAQIESMNLRYVDTNGGLHRNKVGVANADTATKNATGNIGAQGVIGVQAAPVFVQRPVVLNTMPQGHVFRNCTPDEELRRDALMLIRGGLVGLLIGDNSRSTGVGAGAGLFYSMTESCRVAVPQGATTTLGNQGVPATVNVQSNCSVEGNPKLQNLKGLTPEQCAEVAKSSVTQKTDTDTSRKPVPATDVKVDTSTGTATADTCAWVHPRSKQRFDKPAGDVRPCIDFVKEVAGNNGYTIATRQ